MKIAKDCPFCGEDIGPVVARQGTKYTFYQVMHQPNKKGHRHGLIIMDVDEWNTRPIEDALQTRIAALSTRIAEFEAENKWLKAENERLKAIAERAGLIIDTANDEFLRELQSIKLQQKRGPDLDEWGRPKNEVE